MSIIRTNKKENPFAQIDRKLLEDDRLSWKAKGILCYLLSKPDKWEVSVADIEKRSLDGVESIRAGLTELAKNGYAELISPRDEETGQMLGKTWVVSEEPSHRRRENPDVGKTRKSGFPKIGKSDPSNNNNRSNNEIRSNTPLPPCRGIGVVAETNDCGITSDKDGCTGNSAGKKEIVPPPAPPRPAPPRRASWPLPSDWQEVLGMNRLPVVPETLKPRMAGDEWERRLLAFKVFYELYPGNKGGLNKEFDILLKTCHKTKSDIDFVLSVIPWGLKYQADLKQKMRDDSEFVPGWQTMHNWVTGCQWESDNLSMPRQRWERAQLTISEEEYEMYDVRDILPKPTAQ